MTEMIIAGAGPVGVRDLTVVAGILLSAAFGSAAL